MPPPPAFDAVALRRQFPLLANEPALVYLDNAATTHKPLAVLAAERHFYEHANANVHRSAHRLAHAATEAFEGARRTVARFLGAASAAEVVFTRGATEAINLVAQSWARAHLRPGDEIVLSMLEHHANIVPWQLLAAERGLVLRVIGLAADGSLDLDAFHALLGPRTRLVAVTALSNASGVRPPLGQMIAAAQAIGARVLVDAAQAAAHDRLDVSTLGADFLVFSGHKVFGPTGIGVLWAPMAVLDSMPPWQGGGEMIERVSFAGTTFNRPPYRFEAGTPPIAQAVGLAAALDWLAGLDRAALARHEAQLLQRLEQGLAQLRQVHPIASAAGRGPVTSLTFGAVHPFDVAQFLDARDIAVRVGNHCAQPLMEALGVNGTLRISLCAYNTEADVEAVLAALSDTLELLA
ncbi:cysteine desulfurase [Chitiniphilus purpureus]|uniref:Probable cysteine desulfurase n=1 Tax=Chitiniphilus purpureus TaxID=2981137 RepID=A0ABY6DI88_9NEIS|nr:cysteine desulfurase [Chitiniphilus sp. CD1]UXY14060.1 cysteine desulfurase [Chitiniphilus sp. CD1]